MINCICKPRWERRKEARPQELLAAALQHFAERGFAATRLEDVAKAAGVSKGTLYLYYASKEDLFKAVVRENIAPVLGQAEHLLEAYSGHSAELIREVVKGWWSAVGDTALASLPKLMIAEAANFPELAKFYQDEVIVRAENLLANILRRGVERNEIQALNFEVDVKLLMAPLVMMMIWRHPSSVCHVPKEELNTYLERYIEILLHGILRK